MASNNAIVLVTGGSGHLGFRAIAFALESGYRVRAAVRSQDKTNQIKAAKSVQQYLDRLEFVMVPDILADGAYDEAVKGVDYVLHVASPISFPVRDSA
jgi:nucleoside-diphosphate-sugar epimerase